MSFKRDGNDDQWLSRLTKRRVSELLAEDIPEDEALIMKNGRLCCIVCYNRPTFDTLEMLNIHRRGKKHESHASVFYQNQKELEELKEKRRHEMYMNGETAGAVYAAGIHNSSSSFLKNEPYNPQLKRKRLKPNERRQVLQLTKEDALSAATTKEPTPPDITASVRRLPGHGRPGQTQSLRFPATTSHDSVSAVVSGSNHGNQRSRRPAMLHLGPKQKLPQTISDYVKRAGALREPCGSTSVRPYVRSGLEPAPASRDQCSSLNLARGKVGGDNIIRTGECESVSGSSRTEQSVTYSGRESSRTGQSDTYSVGLSESRVMAPRGESETVKKVSRCKKEVTQPAPELDEAKKRAAKKYLQATSSGWKLDWTRQKWIRDDDVEFDSDEEPPELPS